MRKFSTLMLLVALVLFGVVGSAQATKIEYTRSGNTLNFTVYNNTLSNGIGAFDIFFGVTSDGLNFSNAAAFANVTDGSAPAGWTSMAYAPTVLDNPWLYTGFLNGGSAIAPGHSLGGFSTTVTLTTTASLDHLWFNVYDEDFGLLDAGFTERRDTNVVPEPGTFLLFGAGLAGLVLYRRKRG